MTEVFRIPRVRIDAQVVLTGRHTREVSMFLSQNSETHSGHERPIDVLNDSRRFLPVLERDSLVFLNLDSITMVSVPAELEYTEEELLLLDVAIQQQTHRHVEVTMEDGSVFVGDLAYVMPEGQRRVQDFLNNNQRFFRLRDGAHARLINKTRVLWINQD